MRENSTPFFAADMISGRVTRVLAGSLIRVLRMHSIQSLHKLAMHGLAPSKCFRLTYYSGFQINKHCSGYVLSRPSLAEERIEGVVSSPNSFVRGHLAVGLDAVLQTVELPAGISDLNTGLSSVDRNTLTLYNFKI